MVAIVCILFFSCVVMVTHLRYTLVVLLLIHIEKDNNAYMHLVRAREILLDIQWPLSDGQESKIAFQKYDIHGMLCPEKTRKHKLFIQ